MRESVLPRDRRGRTGVRVPRRGVELLLVTAGSDEVDQLSPTLAVRGGRSDRGGCDVREEVARPVADRSGGRVPSGRLVPEQPVLYGGRRLRHERRVSGWLLARAQG